MEKICIYVGACIYIDMQRKNLRIYVTIQLVVISLWLVDYNKFYFFLHILLYVSVSHAQLLSPLFALVCSLELI